MQAFGNLMRSLAQPQREVVDIVLVVGIPQAILY
jgi:hypothetical protein